MEAITMNKGLKKYIIPMTVLAPMACVNIICASGGVPTPDLGTAGNTSSNAIEYGD